MQYKLRKDKFKKYYSFEHKNNLNLENFFKIKSNL